MKFVVEDADFCRSGDLLVRRPEYRFRGSSCAIVRADLVKLLVVPPDEEDVIWCAWIGKELVPLGYSLDTEDCREAIAP